MRNILLVVDMEGCCGIYDMQDIDDCRIKMEREVQYIIDVLHEMGQDKVAVLDCHNDGRNLEKFCLNSKINFYEHIWSIKDAQYYDCAFLIGFHSKKGVDGYFSHTIRSDIADMLLGGKSIGEVGLLINWLSFYDVPVVYISGDQSLRYEIQDYECEFVATKSVKGEKIFLEDIEQDIYKHIERALCHDKKCGYIEDNIVVKTVGMNYTKYLPEEIFDIREELVVFDNTVEFVDKLKVLCDFLNISGMYQYKRISFLVAKLRKCPAVWADDTRAVELLNRRDWRTLNDEEILYLSGVGK